MKLCRLNSTRFAFGCLVLFLLAGAEYAMGATLRLSPSTGSYYTGDSFAVDIFVDTGGENVVAVAAYIKYDPASFRVDSIVTTESIFPMHFEGVIDSTNALVRIGGCKPTPGVNVSSGKVASINVTALSPIDPQVDNVTFLFTPGSTIESTVCRDDGLGTNMLSAVYGARFVVNCSQSYPLSININPSGVGTVTRNPDNTTYCPGDQVTLTASPNSGYTFNSWSGVDSSNGATAYLTINGNRTVTANFICSTPGTPSNPSPSNGATDVSTSPMLSWTASSNTDSYDIYFGTSSNPPYVGNTTSTSYARSGLGYSTAYYWKVVAKNNCGNSTPGVVWSFTTGSAPCATPGTPSGPSPSNGATGISTSPTLSWASSANTDSYDVYFGTSSNPPYAGNTASASYPRSGLSYRTTYYWKIVAKNNCGNSAAGIVWSFTTINPPPITLQSPSNGTVFNSCTLLNKYQPLFQWETSETFTKCTVLLSTSSTDFTAPITKANIRGTQNTWTPPIGIWKKIMTSSYNIGNIQNIYWKVIGTKRDKTTIESEVRSFRVGSPQAVSLNAPLDGSILPSGTSPTFQFNSNCNIKFRLEFSPSIDFADSTKIKGFVFTTRDPNVETTLNRSLNSWQWTLVKKLIGTGTGYFRIKAWDGVNRETVSEVRTFTVQ